MPGQLASLTYVFSDKKMLIRSDLNHTTVSTFPIKERSSGLFGCILIVLHPPCDEDGASFCFDCPTVHPNSEVLDCWEQVRDNQNLSQCDSSCSDVIIHSLGGTNTVRSTPEQHICRRKLTPFTGTSGPTNQDSSQNCKSVWQVRLLIPSHKNFSRNVAHLAKSPVRS